jgi:hypothetical protein
MRDDRFLTRCRARPVVDVDMMNLLARLMNARRAFYFPRSTEIHAPPGARDSAPTAPGHSRDKPRARQDAASPAQPARDQTQAAQPTRST